jgi:hypothetical protein
MERGSDKHSARMDDALEHEVHGMMTAGRDTRSEAWHSPEPSGEDQPDVDLDPDGTLAGGVPDGMSETDVEIRSQIATRLGKECWPADRDALVAKAAELNAPDVVIDRLGQLPAGRQFDNLQDAWAVLSGGAVESQRF